MKCWLTTFGLHMFQEGKRNCKDIKDGKLDEEKFVESEQEEKCYIYIDFGGTED
jgi:hypothetical protein